VNVLKLSNTIIITARIFDVSGVLSAVANIEDPKNMGFYMNSEYPSYGDGIMYDDGAHGDGAAGDGIYGTIFDVSDSSIWNYNSIYWVDISATDRLLNNSIDESSGLDYKHIKSFSINSYCGIIAKSNNAFLCIENPFLISANTIAQSMDFKINGSSDDVSIPIGQTVTLATTITPAVLGKTIIFFDNTDLINIGSAVTDSLGRAVLTYKPLFAGQHVLQALFLGDPINGLDPAIKQISLTITGTSGCAANNNASICLQVLDALSFISQNTINQSITSLAASALGYSVTVTATLPAAASGERAYSILKGGSSLSAGASALVDSSGKVVFKYDITPGNYTASAFYFGNPIKGLLPSVRITTVAR
jgi:hypothetical protein